MPIPRNVANREADSVRKFQNETNNTLPEGWAMAMDIYNRGLVLLHEDDIVMSLSFTYIVADPCSSASKVTSALAAYEKKHTEDNPVPPSHEREIARERAQVDAMIKEVEDAVRQTLAKSMEANRWVGLSSVVKTFKSYKEQDAGYSVGVEVEIFTK